MRLTLRTLLAYLDDTLEPAESKAIGRKIGESATAQELIKRIREVVRRRRITAPPPSGPGAKLDANTVAEYIDNSLSAEELAEVEETCLDSDLYLAEMAASHQILTVVISEPAKVPPMARQRMYGLIQGPEAIPYRKAARLSGETSRARPDADHDESEDMMLLGLPFYRSKGSWLRRLAPFAFGLLAAVVAIVIWTTLPSGRREVTASKSDKPTTAGANVKPPVEKQPKTPDPLTPVGTDKPGGEVEPAVKSGDAPPAVSPTTTPPTTTPPPENAQPTTGTNTARYAPTSDGEPSILLQRGKGQTAWQRVNAGAPVAWDAELMSIPGCRSPIELGRGVNLVLWGTLPGDGSPVTLFESSAQLRQSPDVDLDAKLERGRIGITNTKTSGTGRARIQFKDEVWELTLEPGAELAMELSATPGLDFTREKGKAAPPQAALALFMLKGQAQVKIGTRTQTMREPPGAAVVVWTSQSGPSPGAHTLSSQPPWATAAGRATALAKSKPVIEGMNKRLTGQAPVEETLAALIKDPDSGSQRLAIQCLAATDDLPMLLDLLADERAADARRSSVDALRYWIGQGTDHDQRLYAAFEKKYGAAPAEIIMHLIHGFSPEMRAKPSTYEHLIECLKSDKLPVRELAWMNLVLLPETQEIAKAIPYDPAGGVDQRSAAYGRWKEIIPDGRMPPKNMPAAPKK